MRNLLIGFKNKKGSFAIFAVMAFSAMLIMLSAAIKSSNEMAISSVTYSFGDVWGKSVLGEYDIYLKEKYGLFAFYGDEASIEYKLDNYAEYSFKDKSYISYGSTTCDLKNYSLIITENMKDQIEDIILQGYKPSKSNSDISGENDIETTVNESDRYISSQWIIKSLPSYGVSENISITNVINKVKAGIGLSDILGKAAIDKYIFIFFKDYVTDRGLGETYFQNEIEYIISGKLSDNKAKKETETKIKALRNMLNLYYLYSCDEKREATLALANIVTPGAGAYLTQGVIMEAWAYAEACNDMKILYDQKTVPLLKTDSNWALSLENVFNVSAENIDELEKESFDNQIENKYILPKEVTGQDYEHYLKILICSMSEDVKLLRIMDLIQINMKYTYCDYFLIKDYNVGLSYRISVNGATYEFEESYQK